MKQKFLLLLFLAAVTYKNAFTQPLIRSQRVFGGKDAEGFTSMDITRDGGLILGGWSLSNKSGNKTENSRGFYDYWVVKLDSAGIIQWDKTIGGDDDEWLSALQQTTDGGYILGGISFSNISGEKTENSKGGDYWVVKLDGTGKLQWDKTIGGKGSDELLSLQQTADGGYLLGGGSTSDKSGEKSENSRGLQDYWVVKLNGSGKVQWDKTIGGTEDESLISLHKPAMEGIF